MRNYLVGAVCFVSFFFNGLLYGQKPPSYKQSYATDLVQSSAQNQIHSSKGFEENEGQVTGHNAGDVTFAYKNGDLSIFVMKTGLAYQFSRIIYPKDFDIAHKGESPEEEQKQSELFKQTKVETYRMDVTLKGANPNATIVAEGKSNDYVYYSNAGTAAAYSYSKIIYKDIYPHIDWVIYTRESGVEYDFMIHPGGNPKDIQMQSSFAEKMGLNKDGSLYMHNRMGDIIQKAPIAFQGKSAVAAHFSIDNENISFDINNYNPAETLIIDPQIEWGTYYGGNSANGDNEQGFYTAIDKGTNDVYLAGWTTSSNNIAAGGFQTSFLSGSAAFLAKFNASGQRLWATYYGTGFTRGRSCAVDATGNVYMCGRTDQSANSGGIITTPNAHQPFFGGGVSDAYLVKFSSAGVRQWGTFYGNDQEDTGEGCAVDAAGNVYMTGHTFKQIVLSINNIGAWGYQNSYGGGSYDAYLVKFTGAGVREWGTYYGGNGNDDGLSVCTDPTGNVYLGGTTTATSNPNNSSIDMAFNGFQNASGGTLDAFLVKFSTTGTRLWATYYGGAAADYLQSCNTDATGAVYMAGYAKSANLATAGAFQTLLNGTQDAFLVKFDALGSRLWATYYGGSSNYDEGHSVVTDPATNNVYLSGFTASANNVAGGGFQNTLQGAYDMFITKFNSNGQRIWGSYYGGAANDQNYGSVVDGNSNIYLAGFTKSTTGIATNGFQNTYGGGPTDAYLVKVSPCSTPVINTQPLPYGTCNGDTAMFTIATVADAIYQWQENTGNGFVNISNTNLSYFGTNKDTLRIYNPTTSSNGNTYRCLVSSDPYCPTLASNAALLTIHPSYQQTVDSYVCRNQLPFSFEGEILTQSGTYTHHYQSMFGCDSVSILNLTVAPLAIKLAPQSIQGCTSLIFEGKAYTSTNTINDTLYNVHGCDSAFRTVNIFIFQPSATTLDTAICEGDIFVLGNENYSSAGTYTQTFANRYGCDSVVTLHLKINALPVLSITNMSTDSKVCLGDIVTLKSSGATTYTWTLNGDTENPIFGNPYSVHLTAEQNYVTLKGADSNGCSDTASISLLAQNCCDVMLVPNAFTPNGDGMNDQFEVNMRSRPHSFRLAVFNRWGQMVFESQNIDNHWDGSFKGQQAEPGNYFYTLQFECQNNKVVSQKGDITLLR
jgi:gliding motility-associated-like protein